MTTAYRRTFLFNLGMSAFWFATSYKWFILLFVLIPDKVSTIVPGGEKNGAWGLVLGTGAFWALIGPSIFGRIYETAPGKLRNRGPWIALGSGITCLAILLIGGANSLLTLAAAYLLLQISDDLGTGPYAGMVADTVPAEHRGYASSILGGFKLFGQIASAIAALILRKPEVILVGIAVVNVLSAAITIYTIRHLPNADRTETKRQPWIEEYLSPFKNPDFRAVWLNRFIVAFAFGCVTAYALNFLKDMLPAYTLFGADLKDAKSSANILALTISFAGIFGAVFSARIADRTGRKPLLVTAAIILSLSLFPVAFFKEFTPIWICVFLFGIGNGIFQSSDWAIASDVLPNPDKAATEMGAWQSSETSVQVLVGLIMGQLIDALNRQYPGEGRGYQAMVIIASTLFLASIFAVRSIKSAR
ncbi:MAG: MFS transporter [Fimbriimonadaceae bacterium]|nr:MFS transporter [Fimbriimonadaceae bacterium]